MGLLTFDGCYGAPSGERRVCKSPNRKLVPKLCRHRRSSALSCFSRGMVSDCVGLATVSRTSSRRLHSQQFNLTRFKTPRNSTARFPARCSREFASRPALCG
jgi:hypothetical protein